MAATIMKIATANEIQFIPEGVELPLNYHQKQFDREWMYDNLLPFQLKKRYNQLKQLTDRNCVQVHFNTAVNNVHLEIWDKDFQLVDSITGTGFALAGNIEDGIALNSKQFDFVLSNTAVGTTEGTYYYVISASYGGDTKLFISEPINVKADWKNTVLIEYTHDENDFNIAFLQNARFSIRLDAYLVMDDVREYNDQYDDIKNTSKDLYAETVRIVRLQINKIPWYLFEKLKEAWRCRTVIIERFRYSRAKGAQWEKESFDSTPLLSCSVLLNSYNPKDHYTFKTGAVLQLLPDSGFPYASGNVTLTDPQAGNVVLTQLTNLVVEDGTTLDNLVIALNTQFAALGLLGVWSVTGGWLQYENAENENFTVLSQLLKPKVFNMVIGESLLSPKTFSFQYKNSNYTIIDWGDNNVEQMPIPLGTSATMSHTYASASTNTTIRVFHNDDITRLDATVLTKRRLVEITGTMSSVLLNHTLTNIDGTVTNWDLTYLYACRVPLKTLSITGTFIQTFTSDPFATTPGVTNFSLLKSVDLSHNALTQAGVATVMANFVAGVNLSGPGTFRIDNQTPAVTPNTSINNSTTAFLNAGWFVFV